MRGAAMRMALGLRIDDMNIPERPRANSGVPRIKEIE